MGCTYRLFKWTEINSALIVGSDAYNIFTYSYQNFKFMVEKGFLALFLTLNIVKRCFLVQTELWSLITRINFCV